MKGGADATAQAQAAAQAIGTATATALAATSASTNVQGPHHALIAAHHTSIPALLMSTAMSAMQMSTGIMPERRLYSMQDLGMELQMHLRRHLPQQRQLHKPLLLLWQKLPTTMPR